MAVNILSDKLRQNRSLLTNFVKIVLTATEILDGTYIMEVFILIIKL